MRMNAKDNSRISFDRQAATVNVPFSDNLQQFNADYLRLTKQVAESCRNHDLTDSMIIGTLYLITEHTSFYERYGWKYLCMVQCDDGEQMRMYIYHSTSVLR